jgi:predicted branched-subunit amino acid permease
MIDRSHARLAASFLIRCKNARSAREGSSISTAADISARPYRKGFLDAIPLAIPSVPFGFILGLAVVEAPIDSFVGWFGAWFLFAGAAQLTMITLLTDGATVVAAVIAALVVNARHFMYSMAVAAPFQRQPAWFRWVGSYALIDPVFAMVDPQRDLEPRAYRRYYFGIATTILVPWTIWVALGITLGASIPASWNIAFAVPVLFVGLMVLGIRGRPGVVAAVVAFTLAIVFSGLPNRLGLLIGAVVGVAAAAFMPLAEETS